MVKNRTIRHVFFQLLSLMLLISILLIIIAIYQFSKVEMGYFSYGITETNTINMRFSGGDGKVYEADIPKNYLKMKENSIDYISKRMVQSPLQLWVMYPDFNGYSKEYKEKAKSGGLKGSFWVSFDLAIIDDFPESQLQKRYGQRGLQELLDAHWKYSHELSEKQSFDNPKEYIVKWQPKHKDYIYNSGDHFIRIECIYKDKPLGCQAYKRYGYTTIAIIYSFSNELIYDFGRIEREIDKLLASFNIREIPNFTVGEDALKRRKKALGSLFNSCYPRSYGKMIEDINNIIEVDFNNEWISDNYLASLVRDYIPQGCNLDRIKKSLSFILNIDNINYQKKETNNSIIFFIYLQPNKWIFWKKNILEIKIEHSNNLTQSIVAKTYHSNIF